MAKHKVKRHKMAKHEVERHKKGGHKEYKGLKIHGGFKAMEHKKGRKKRG